MSARTAGSAFILGLFICVGLASFGWFVADAALRVKALDRTVTVKGLSEKEVAADIAIWPITFNEVDNELGALTASVEAKNETVIEFLKQNGFTPEEITVAPPAIIDRQAQGYVDADRMKYRYTAVSTLTVYTKQVEKVLSAKTRLAELGKQGIALAGQDYNARTEFLFTGLNALKPGMIEEATKQARAVAEKFAQDSQSVLGKIKSAQQGQFSISDRDSNNPHIKNVRVVSTVEYYLSD